MIEDKCVMEFVGSSYGGFAVDGVEAIASYEVGLEVLVVLAFGDAAAMDCKSAEDVKNV